MEGYKDIGGLRISKTTDSPADNGHDIIKQYQYSNAALFSVPTYFREILDNAGVGGLVCLQDAGKKIYEISSSSVMPMLTSQGNHIGYGNVTVVKPGFGRIGIGLGTEHQSFVCTVLMDAICSFFNMFLRPPITV